MSNDAKENGWNEYSKLVLKELETLAEGIQQLNTELQEVRKDLLRLEAREIKVDDIKVWKEKVDEIMSPSQMKELRDQVAEHENFKTKAITVFAVVQFLMAAALFAQKFT
jgi:alanyl-tRNA synthetase